MATQTKHYGLLLPAQEDFYNVDDFNGNATKIDEKLFAQEQEIVGIGQKLDVVGQNVTANGEKITGVGQKVDLIGNKLGTPQDTGKDTIFGALTNNKMQQLIYEPNQNMVQQHFENVFIEETKEKEFSGPLMLGHFHAETDGCVYITCSVSHTNYTTGSYTTQVFSGLVSESFRKAPVAAICRTSIPPTPLYSCPTNSSYYGGGILPVQKGMSYDFVLLAHRLYDIKISFRLCYEMKTVEKK